METVRQRMITLLCEDEMDARELSQSLHIMEKEVYDHLRHIGQSVKAQKKKLNIHPSICKSCGFTFKDRPRVTRPSRCPHCKKTYIKSPTFSIS